MHREHERLGDIGDALMQLRARMHHIEQGNDPGVQVLPQGIAAPIVDHLAASVTRVDTVVLENDVGAGADDITLRNVRARVTAGQRQRCLVHPEVLSDEYGRLSLGSLREAGQDQRVTEAIGTEFVVLGTSAAITLATWGDPASSYIVIRNPALVRCFAGWFDAVWASAPAVAPATGDDRALIQLLGLGAKDEAIARSLELSLRTVRRRVAALMDEYGVDTRFQLGAALERDSRL